MSFKAEQAQFSCTLNRAHKLAERVRQMLGDEANKARAAFSPVSLQGFAGEHQVEAMIEQGLRGETSVARHAVLNEALRLLRSAIGRANVEAGVHDLLSEQDALNRRLQALRSVVDCRPMTAIDPLAMANYQPIVRNEGALRASMVTVATMSSETLDRIQAEIADLEKALYALSDRIAERNLTRITISIDSQLAEDIGLSKR